jgi:undecaprenyl diphosphate synthase
MKLPNHVAIIMDGNGRWGIKNHGHRLAGHRFGVKKIKSVIQFTVKKKIKHLTLYALSYDNLSKRGKKEIGNLFYLLEEYIKLNIKFFIKNKIKINILGEKKRVPQKTLKLLEDVKIKTNFKKNVLNLNIALNYSSKEEIINSMKNIVNNELKINKKNIEKFLYTKDSSHPDILIRTGGYNRLSDFLLWQCAYTEIFFINKMWPDFLISDYKKILLEFSNIKRKFGS